MQVALTRPSARIRVQVLASHPDSEGMPVQLNLFDPELRVLGSQWTIVGDRAAFEELTEEKYIVQLRLPSGLTMNRLKDMEQDSETEMVFHLHEISPMEISEWTYLLSNAEAWDGRYDGPEGYARLQCWRQRPEVWEPVNLDNLPREVFFGPAGAYLKQYIGADRCVLEVQVTSGSAIYVCLPPHQEVRVALQYNSGQDREHFPYHVLVSSMSRKAETILALMRSTGTAAAKTTFEAPASLAERMLYEKVENPIEAAIGGYYLLKSKEYERLHHWANNLANWFRWMPDGSIIHAWQLIADPKKGGDLLLITDRLIYAFACGMPMYTEGLRLLYDGLIWAMRQRSGPLEDLLNQIYLLMAEIISYADWEQSMTTFKVPGYPGYWIGYPLPADHPTLRLAVMGCYDYLRSHRPEWARDLQHNYW